MTVNFDEYKETFQLKFTTYLVQRYASALEQENKAKT